MTVMTICPICRKSNLINVCSDDYEAWQNGTLIQDAFPYLSAEDRECLMTGFCSECWDKMFGMEEEEEEPEEFDYDFIDTYCETGFNPYIGCYDWDC